ncbi:MAG TPA: DUF4159 domain-containing protein [Tepidisphaeraceae bacterium]|jgi:hypothetical protein
MRTSRLLVVAIILGACAAPCLASVSNSDIEASLKRAKAFLYSKLNRDNWEVAPHGVYHNDNLVVGGQWGGVTALATYALLASGESPQDPRLAPAIEFLKKADLRGTYALAMRMQVWLLLPPTKDVKALANADKVRLLTMTQSRGNARGMHDYTALGSSYSHSRSQYAVLAMWAADQMGLEVPNRYWAEAEAGWIRHQDISGGWTYAAPEDVNVPVTPGMTAAGVATLFITQDYLHAGNGIGCQGNVDNPAIERGVEWLAQNFDKVATDERYTRDFPFATLYAVERVGVASGRKYFGPHDWYAKGVTWLLGMQKPDGSFNTFLGSGPMDGPIGPVVDTSFATLFLARGRAPVAINKLDYSGPASDVRKAPPWDQRPRDVANVVRWIGRQLELDLNWQVVNANVPATELLDAPILYIAGSRPIDLTPAQVATLRSYVEMGGLIVAHADCASPAFAASVRKLGQEMFPDYAFRELPQDHFLYHNLFNSSKWKQRPQIQGLSNGARELMLLIHGQDTAKLWQIRSVKGHEEAWELAANLFRTTFESRGSLRFKGDTHWVTPDGKIEPKRTLSLARLRYDGNWNPEPGGWQRLAAILHNDFGLELRVGTVKPGEGKLSAGYKVAHLTGTGKVKLDVAAREELRDFVQGGGTLIIDAAGGSGEFADSAELLMMMLFPNDKARLLPPEHPVYRLAETTIPIDYRNYARKTLVSGLRTGRLMGIELDKRLAVVFSREDLSVGLVGQDVDGVLGYTPATATRLMASVVMGAAGKASATSPTTIPVTPPASRQAR